MDQISIPDTQSDSQRDWTILNSTIERFCAAHDLSTVVAVALETACDITLADAAVFLTCDDLACRCVGERGTSAAGFGPAASLSIPLAERVRAAGRPFAVADVRSADGLDPAWARDTGIGSLAILPIGSAQPAAAIGVYWAATDRPTDAIVARFAALARMTATTLANLERLRSQQRRADDVTTLFRLTDVLYRTHSPEAMYAAAMDAIEAALGCRRASVLLYDDADVMRFVASRGLSDAYRRQVEGHTPWQRGDTEARPIFIENFEETDQPDAIKAAVRDEGIVGVAFIPLVAAGGVFGKFMAYHDTPHCFDDREIAIAETIARQLGFSLERARTEALSRTIQVALRESEARFRLMSENAPVMIWISDQAGQCLHLNRMLRDFWNVSESAVGAFDWRATVHPDDVTAVGRKIGAALAARRGVRLEGRYRDALGRYRVLQTDARPYFSSDGTFLGMIGANVDITDRRVAEQALRESEERFRALFETNTQGVMLLDRDGTVYDANPTAAAIIDVPPDRLIGADIRTLALDAVDTDGEPLPPELRPAGIARRTGRTVADFTIGLRRAATNELRWVDMDAVPQFREGEAEMHSIFLLLSDVTESRRLAQAERTLAAEVDHRAKNMLALVQAIIRLSKSDSPEAFLEAVEGRIAALARAHSLLSVSKWSDVSLHSVFEEAVAAYSGGNGSDRVALTGPPLYLKPEAAQPITLLVHELTTNAAKYGALASADGRVLVRWAVDAAAQALVIEWTEAGGPPVRAPTKQSFGSRLIRLTVESDLDGTIDKEWRPDGLHARIEIPLRHVGTRTGVETKVADEPAPQRPPGTGLAGARVLVVEDNGTIAAEMSDQLRALGCTVVGPAGTLARGLHLATTEAIDAALLDVDLHGEMVYPLAEYLDTRETPFAFNTGFSVSSVLNERWPEVITLQKPVSQRDVSRTLATLLASSQGS